MSSKRAVRRRACQRKRHYDTQAAAWGHAEWLKRTTGNADYHAYRCAWGHWHAGRYSRRARAGRDAALRDAS